MKRVRIAYVGVFDLKNYGDHLFPLIFKHEMTKRKLDFELILFSNYDYQQNFESNYKIHSVGRLDEIHQETPIDFVIIGGGEIIHPHAFKQKLEIDGVESEVDYEMLDIWMKPILFCEEKNIPCVLNGVGVPFELGSEPIIADLFDICTYISVRNEASKQFLLNTGVNKEILQIPDVAFLVSSVYAPRELKNARERLGLKEKYIVFQCGKGLPAEAKDTLKDVLKKEQAKGYEVVFLPLSYTNQDDVFLNELAREFNLSIKTFPRTLHVEEIAAVLAGCSYYIGLSFHGAITAASYGVMPILFDYHDQVKTQNLYDYMNIPELRATTPEELYDILERQDKVDKQIVSGRVKEIQNEITQHFNTLYNIIVDYDCENISKDTSKDICSYKESYIRTLFRLKGLQLQNREIERMLSCYGLELNNKKFELEETQKVIAEQKRLIEDYKMDLRNKLELLAKVKNDMKNVQDERDALEQFRQEVIHSKSFRLLHMFDGNKE